MSGIPTGDWSWVHAAAERFEQAWKAGPRPRIEDFLAAVEESRWPPLLEELIRVESELRRRAGEPSSAEEYQRRFPECVSAVDAVFGSQPPGSPAVDGAPLTTSTVPAPTSALATEGPLPAELAEHPDYEIIRELGRGGMGVVYLVHNRIMDRDEVLKVMGQDVFDDPGVLKRFLKEIRAVAKLRHPNIVSAFTAFRCGRSLVFCMEYVAGLDFRRMVNARGPMPVGHACYYVHQAALGLQHAHEAGMVHRDIKPGNLMLTHKAGKAVIKVLDFGLAKAGSEQNALDSVPAGAGGELTAAGVLTLPGQMLGTPDFIAPEQIADSQNADTRADIYSLGCTLYFLLSGCPPFQAASIGDTLQAHRFLDARPLNLVRPEVPAELAALVAKMMAKEPDRRFQTPSEVANALAPFFKKPTAAAVSPKLGVDQNVAPDAVRGAQDPAAETGHGMWSSLIDFRDTEDDADAVANALSLAEERLRWLWPAGAAAVLLCGLIGAWAAGVFKGALVREGGVELAGAEASTGTGQRKPVRVPHEPLIGSRPSNTSPPVTAPSPATEASTATQGNDNTPAVFGDGASETFPPVAEPSPESKPPTPTLATANPVPVFHEITAIKSPGLVTQARLISDSGHVLFETEGRNRALWRGDLKDPEKLHKLDASVPAWVHLALSIDGRFAVLAGVDNRLWNWDLQSGQSRPLIRPGRASITAIALSPDNQLVAYVREGAIQFCEAVKDATGKKKGAHQEIWRPDRSDCFLSGRSSDRLHSHGPIDSGLGREDRAGDRAPVGDPKTRERPGCLPRRPPCPDQPFGPDVRLGSGDESPASASARLRCLGRPLRRRPPCADRRRQFYATLGPGDGR